MDTKKTNSCYQMPLLGSKYHTIVYAAGALYRIPLRKLTALSRTSSWIQEGLIMGEKDLKERLHEERVQDWKKESGSGTERGINRKMEKTGRINGGEE